MKLSEQFALDTWLSYHPMSMTYDEIIEAMTDRENNAQAQNIDVWQTVETYDYEEVAEFIQDTQTHFKNIVRPVVEEYKTALQELLQYTGDWDITDKDHPIYKARKLLEKELNI
jgi:hypothetical protein